MEVNAEAVIYGIEKLADAFDEVVHAFSTVQSAFIELRPHLASARANARRSRTLSSSLEAGAGVVRAPIAVAAITPSLPLVAAKRKRAERDPDAPKPPLSAYLEFQKSARPQIKSELGGDASSKEVMTKLGEQWKSLPEAEKTKFQIAYDNRLKAYREEKARYEASKGLDAITPDPTASPAVKRTAMSEFTAVNTAAVARGEMMPPATTHIPSSREINEGHLTEFEPIRPKVRADKDKIGSILPSPSVSPYPDVIKTPKSVKKGLKGEKDKDKEKRKKKKERKDSISVPR